MDPATMSMVAQGAATGVGGIFGLINQKGQDRRQLRQQEKLQNLQIVGNKEMADYNQQKEMEMWHATNYGPQMREMEAAGLNPALMYGMGGGGGVTTGSPGGGVSGAEAPKGGGEVMGMMQMGLAAQMQQAQIELTKATAEKTKTETAKIGGVDTDLANQQIKNYIAQEKNAEANTLMTQAQTDFQQIQNEIATNTQEAAEEIVHQKLQQLLEQNKELTSNNKVLGETEETRAQILRNTAALQLAQKAATQAGTNLTNQQINESINKVAQNWHDLRRKDTEMSQKQADMLHYQMIYDLKDSLKIPMQAAAGVANTIIGKIGKPIGKPPIGTKPPEVGGFGNRSLITGKGGGY